MRRKFLLAVMTLSLLFCAMGAGDLYAQTEVATSDALQTALSSDGEVKLKLINNITVDATVTVAESVTATLDLNGFAITGTMHKSNGGVIENNGSLTLIGGTIESTADNGGSALVNSGEAIVNNVTLIGAPNADGSWPSYTVNNTGVMSIIDSELTSYHGTIASYGEGAVVTMTDTDIDMSGIAGFTSHAIYTYDDGAAVVYSGNIANKATDQNNTGGSVINGAVTIYGGNFNGRVENYYGTPVIYAGTFKHGETNLDVTKYVAAGCEYKDGVVTAPEGYIFTAEQLKTALQKSGTYTLGADITVTEQIEVPFLSGDYKPVEIALNLNGHKIIADGKIYPINNNGNLTINDIEGNTGGIEGLGLLNGKDGASGNTRSAAASLTINGGTYKNLFDEGAALYAHLGSITINGGRFIGKHAAVWNENANYINISGGYFEGDYAAIINEKYIKFDKGELNGLYLGENGYSCVVSDDVIVYEARIIKNSGYTSYKTLEDAVEGATDGDVITIITNHNGSYKVPSGKNITITGADVMPFIKEMPKEPIKFANIGAHNMYGASMTFNNVTFDYYPNANYTGLQHSGNLVYNNCTFEGQPFLYGTSETFNNCTFNQNSSDAYNVWTYGAKEVAFNECTFNSAGKSVLVYNEGACATDLTVTDTKFIATATVDDKAAIEIDCSLMPKGTSIVIEGVDEGKTTATGFGENTKSGSSLWNDKKVVEGAPNGGTSSEVIIDDVVVKEPALMDLAGGGTEENPYLISTLEDLIWFRYQVNAGVTGVNYYAGKYIALAADIDLIGENWVGIGTATADHGFMGNFDGNGYKIKNLTITNPALDSDGYAYAGFFGVTEGTDKDNQNTIKNLTIENVTINTTGHIAAAAVAYPYYTIIDNVKVCGDIKIKGGDYTSGALAYTRRCVNASKIIVSGSENSYITGANVVGGVISDIQMNDGLTANYSDFEVSGVTITGTNMVGGISGIISSQTLNGCSVKNVTLSCEDNNRIGIVSGSLGGVSTVSNVDYENVTGATAIIGATYDGGKAVEAKIGDTYYATLQTAIDAAKAGDNTIQLLADITGNVTILQQEGINIVIDGKKAENENYTFNGTINIYGDARILGEETLTIQNINFYTEDNARYFIHAYDNGQIEGTNNHKQYAHNVTVENCKFATSAVNKPNTIVGMRFRQANDISAVNCTSDGIFSIMWTTAVDGLTLNGVEATKCTEGITIGGASKKVNIIGTTIESDTYAIRAEGAGSDFIIENSTLVAKVPVVVRNVTENSMIISFTFNGTNTITESNPTNYWFVAGETEYNGTSEVMPTAPKGQVSVTLNDTGLRYEDVYGNYYELAGEGTADNPYTIANLYELKFFRDDVNAGNNYQGKYIKVTATEIDLNNEEWTPIAYMGKTFKGNFDGNNVTVKNLKITKALTNSAENNGIGFFGRTDSPATIENIIIEDVDITGSLYVGAIVGYGYTGKHVKGCTVKGDITIDAWWYAGVIGGNGYMNLIDNCHVIGNGGSYIKGNDGSYIGGIWGFRGEGNNKITNCTVTNLDIIGVDRVGGICGIGHYGNTISGCDAEDVTVTATDPEATTIGLLVGATQGNNISGEGPTIFEDNDASGITAQIDNGDGTYTEVTNLYGTNINGSTPVTNYVAQIVGGTQYATLAEAVAAAVNNDVITLLPTNAPIAMNASLYGKNVTITGTATVDWSKGNLFVGRGGEGNATLTFDNANLTSASDQASTGIHVSGREKNTNNKYDGTVIIKNNSTIELDYLINKGTMTLDESTLTVKNGFSIGGRPASETESGVDATATITLSNNSKVVVNNHNGMDLGYEAIGVMNIDATSTFETTQAFLITAKGTMNVNGGNVKVAGTLTNAGTVYVTGAANLDATVTGAGWFYMNGVTLDADTELLGAKVGFINGENTIVGSTIKDGWFSVGIGKNTDAETAAAFATANDITLGDVTVNVSDNATVYTSTDAAYSGWVGSAYSADKDANKYILNINNSLARFGYMHVSKDGEMNVTGQTNNKYEYAGNAVDFYAGTFINNGNVTLNGVDAWAQYTKISVDHADAVLNITNGTKYEANCTTGNVNANTFLYHKAGTVNVDATSSVNIEKATTLVEGAVLNIASNKVIAKGAVTGNGTINLTDLAAKFTAQEGLTVNNGVEGNTDYGVTYVNGAYQFAQYVAQIGDNKYLTLAEAIEAVAENGTVKLIADETFTENNRTNSSGTWYEGVYYVGDKNFTIDLNNYKVTQNGAVNDYMFLFKNDGEKDNTITFKNGTIDAGKTGDEGYNAYCALVTATTSTQKITINTENIEFIGNNSDGAVLKIRGGDELNVNAGTKITGEDSYVGIECYDATVNIYDGAEIYQNGTSSYNGCLVGVGGNGTVNVYGGKGTSAKGGFIAMTSGGTINVAGGEWIANTDGTVGDNSNLYVLTAQNNKNEPGYAGASIINVTGGTFRGGMDAWILNDPNVEKAELNISGGNFNADPENYVIEGFAVETLSNGTYNVIPTSGTQTRELEAEWYWFSTYVDLNANGQNSLDIFKSAFVGEDNEVKVRQIKNQNGYVSYNSAYDIWVSDGGLLSITNTGMYMINMKESHTLELTGDFAERDLEITLNTGWNWIGYPVNEEINLTDALSELEPSTSDMIKSQTKSAIWTGSKWKVESGFDRMIPGEGYKYFRKSGATKFSYSTDVKPTSKSDDRSEEYHWIANANQYPGNMTVIAMLSIDNEIVNDNYEIAAFANGECRGSARPIYDEDLNAYILILTIQGEEVEELTFKYYDVNYGTEYELGNRINYSDDAIVGSFEEPYMFNLGILNIDESSVENISIYPNPTTTGKEINLQAVCDKVEVFNALGVKVAEYTNVDSIDAIETAGIYVIRVTIDGNARNCRLIVK